MTVGPASVTNPTLMFAAAHVSLCFGKSQTMQYIQQLGSVVLGKFLKKPLAVCTDQAAQ